jgi:hypothetical protein
LQINTMTAHAPTRPTTTEERLTFVVKLRAEPGVNPILALRALLKSASRRFGLRCISAREDDNNARSNDL